MVSLSVLLFDSGGKKTKQAGNMERFRAKNGQISIIDSDDTNRMIDSRRFACVYLLHKRSAIKLSSRTFPLRGLSKGLLLKAYIPFKNKSKAKCLF